MTTSDFNNFQDKLTRSYDEEMGNLLSDYPFILEDEFDYEFPTDPNDRLDLLIKSTSQFQFIEAKYKFLRSTIGISDRSQLAGEIAKLERLLKPKQNEDPLYQDILYADAVAFMFKCYEHLFFWGSSFKIDSNIVLEYIISLINSNYFKKISLPEAAYYVDYTDNVYGLTMIAEVYGKYYLFYDYLKKLETKLKKKKAYNILDELPFNGTSYSLPNGNNFMDRFRANFTKKNEGLCEKIVAQLSVEHNTSCLKTLNSHPILKKYRGETDFKVNITLRARKGIIAALVNYLIDTGCWKKIDVSKRYLDANRIFELDFPNHSMFSQKQSYPGKPIEYLAIEELLDPILEKH